MLHAPVRPRASFASLLLFEDCEGVAKRAARSFARRARTRGNAAKNQHASSARIGARSENGLYRIEDAAKYFFDGNSAKPHAAAGRIASLQNFGKDSQGMIVRD